MNENTSGPQASDLPATHTVSTDDLADYPVGTMIAVDGEVLELFKRYQTDEGVRVVLIRQRYDADHGPAGMVRLEVARGDCAEPLWEVFAEQPTD